MTVSSVLSIVGSSLIIISVLKQHDHQKRHQNGTLHQLLLGLSLSDILFSLGCATLTYMLPAALMGDIVPWAWGNQASCSVSGFTVMVSSTIGSFYNCFISLHFWNRIRATRSLSLTSPRRDTMIRLATHTTAIAIPVLFCLVGLLTESFNAHFFPYMCYLGDWPIDCTENPDVECERGGGTGPLLGRIRTGIIALLGLISIYCSVSIWLRVRANFRQSRMTVESSGLDSHDSFDMSTIRASLQSLNTNRNRRSNKDKREQEVYVQAILYTLAYFNSFIFVLIASILINTTDVDGKQGEWGHFVLLFLTVTFMPLQGALNFIIFIRPRYQAWKVCLTNRENLEERHAKLQLEQQQQAQQQAQQQQQQQEQQKQEGDPTTEPTSPVVADDTAPVTIKSNNIPWWRILRKAILEEVPPYRRAGRRPPHSIMAKKGTNVDSNLDSNMDSNLDSNMDSNMDSNLDSSSLPLSISM